MNGVESLLTRIDAEISAANDRVKAIQQEKVAEYQVRQERLTKFGKACDRLHELWDPRLDALAQRFDHRVSMTPQVTPMLRQTTFRFESELARIVLIFSATTDSEVQNLVLKYDLEILPILMQFKKGDELEMPLDQLDEEAITQWIDDRILDFVKTFLTLHQNDRYLSYLKDHTVLDPVAGLHFPKYAAAAKCEWNGQTYYFIGEETLHEFRTQNGIAE